MTRKVKVPAAAPKPGEYWFEPELARVKESLEYALVKVTRVDFSCKNFGNLEWTVYFKYPHPDRLKPHNSRELNTFLRLFVPYTDEEIGLLQLSLLDD